MSDLPLSQPQPANNAETLAPAFARLIARFQTARAAWTQAMALNAERRAQRRAQRRAPEEILAAQARREAARRATDRLLQHR